MTGASIETPRYTLRRWLPWLGALIGVAALAWVLRGFDLSRFLTIATGIDARFVLMVPLTIIIEQMGAARHVSPRMAGGTRRFRCNPRVRGAAAAPGPTRNR